MSRLHLLTTFVTFRSSPSPPLRIIRFLKRSPPARRSIVAGLHSAAPAACFGWEDVLREAEAAVNDPSDLRGYFQRVWTCNRGSELRRQFIPFVIDGEVVGYIHECFVNHLIKFQEVFTFLLDKASCAHGAHVSLHSSLKIPELRTRAVGDVIKSLGDLIPGIRNELYPVTSSFGKQIFFSLERAAAPYFGIKPFGITCKENLVKECEEEAGIPRFIAEKAISVGAVSYIDTEGYRFKRDVLFCYDLELPMVRLIASN
ncbi:hypothetical protein KSP39_PZI006321 [Platanthera zijinensis]|uniref:DUF4743 domain-containing protein n=1 Tax=Platanthera zijinensis TaxID=2320716 RepID=A0AAP0GB43_9ASPA